MSIRLLVNIFKIKICFCVRTYADSFFKGLLIYLWSIFFYMYNNYWFVILYRVTNNESWLYNTILY